MTTGQCIKAARKRAGLTQKQLGEKLGLSFQSVAQWENDLRNPKKETIQRIADALGVSPIDIIGDGGTIYLSWIDYGMSEEDIARENQNNLLIAFRQLNNLGQSVAVGRIEELTEIPRYRRQDAPQSPPPPQEGKDPTPPPDGSEGPPEGE